MGSLHRCAYLRFPAESAADPARLITPHSDSYRMVESHALSATLTDDLADVNFTLDDLGEPFDLLTRTDCLLTTMAAESSVTSNSRVGSGAGISSSKNEPIEQHQARLLRAARQRQIYRKHQKLEREDLQRQAIELNDELVRLKHARAKEEERLEASRPPSFYLWKSVALRHLEERRLAEAEQRQLIAALNTQTAYFDTLSSISQPNSKVFMNLVGQNHFPSLDTSLCSKTVETALFDACIRELDANYTRADEVLAACFFGEMKTKLTVQAEQKCGLDGKQEFLQQATKEVHPLSLYETSCFLWDVTERYHAEKVAYKRHEDVRDPENTYAITFVDKLTLSSGEEVVVRQHLILRRFFEDGRIVIAWKFVSEGQGIASGMYQENIGWCWLYPSTDTTEPGTIRATYSRRLPMHYSSTVSEDTRIELDRMLQENDQEAWDEVDSSFEQLLLDNVLATVKF